MSVLRKLCQDKILETHEKYPSMSMTLSCTIFSKVSSYFLSLFWHSIILKPHGKYRILKTILSLCSSSVCHWVIPCAQIPVKNLLWTRTKTFRRSVKVQWTLFSFIIFTLRKMNGPSHGIFSCSLQIIFTPVCIYFLL